VKSFEFDRPMKMRYFINEMLAYQDRMNHHSKMTLLSDMVIVETHTHDVENVTEQDLKLAKFADEVYDDTRFFST
jgi:pterin-4a-carbinolamine dehydratase